MSLFQFTSSLCPRSGAQYPQGTGCPASGPAYPLSLLQKETACPQSRGLDEIRSLLEAGLLHRASGVLMLLGWGAQQHRATLGKGPPQPPQPTPALLCGMG